MRKLFIVLIGIVAGTTASLAGPLFHMAENGVQVAMVGVARMQEYTEVRLQAQTNLKNVCWAFKGDGSPYLIAGDHRYTFVGGDRITDCPTRRDYALNETMVLRFRPLPADVRQFSLVEGEGGESQMINPEANRNQRFWNFLRVPLE